MASQVTPLLTIEEVARYLRTTHSALYAQRHRREDPGALGIKVGRRILWRQSELEGWLDSQRYVGGDAA